MKKHLYKIIAVALLSLLAVSCAKYNADNDMGFEARRKDFGVVTRMEKSGYFEVMLDDGALLKVVEYYGTYEATLGERVYFTYDMLRQTGSDGNSAILEVRGISFSYIVSKPVVRESFICENYEHRSDSIGNDLINVYKADLSGNYINIQFSYLREEGSEKDHLITLVLDDMRQDTDSLFFRLHHNAYGETPGSGLELKSSSGVASFRLNEFIPADEQGFNMKLSWNWNLSEEGDYSVKGTFIPSKKVKITGSIYTPPVENTAFVK